MTVWAIVVAAGRGARYGGPKHRAVVAGRGVLEWSVDAARTIADGVVVVVAADEMGAKVPGADAVVVGGATRSESVRCGLARVPADAEVIVVHDAARPAAPAELFAAVVAAVRTGADGAVPGVPVTDTIKVVEGNRVVDTPHRASLVAVQTPQAFAAPALRAAHEAAAEAGAGDVTDDATLVERAGGRVVVVPGEQANVKLTSPADLVGLEAALARVGSRA